MKKEKEGRDWADKRERERSQAILPKACLSCPECPWALCPPSKADQTVNLLPFHAVWYSLSRISVAPHKIFSVLKPHCSLKFSPAAKGNEVCVSVSVCPCLALSPSVCLSVCLSLSTRFGDQRPANAILKTVWITLYCSFLSKVTLRRKRRRIQKEDEETKNSPLSHTSPPPPPPPPQEYCFLIHPGASL